MTREQVSQRIQSNQLVEDHTRSWCESLVDEVFYAFETRVCENCKYAYEEEDGVLICNSCFYDNAIYDVADNFIHDALFYPDKDFGCNKFEPKAK